MLDAWLLTKDKVYKDIAVVSMKFLSSKIFNKNGIEVISNKKWLKKGEEAGQFGEQPIDVAYTILTQHDGPMRRDERRPAGRFNRG
jgi:hypothetical protein